MGLLFQGGYLYETSRWNSLQQALLISQISMSGGVKKCPEGFKEKNQPISSWDGFIDSQLLTD